MPYRQPAEIRTRLPMLERRVVKTSCRQAVVAGMCVKCNQPVHDVSAMTEDEAEGFLAAHLDDDEPAVRLYRRPDRTLLASECPEGAKARHARRVGVAAIATACVLAGVASLAGDIRLPRTHDLPLRTRARVEVPRRLPPVMVTTARPPDDEAVAIAWGRPDPPSPVLRPEVTLVEGPGRLDPRAVQRTLRMSYGRFRLCYESALRDDPVLEGSVAVKLVIGLDGGVDMAADRGSDMPSKDVVTCVVRATSRIAFPQPEGGVVHVSTRISFRPRA